MIRVLDKFIADKIAAGEVIERPVSAVKELVENSVDAGAHSVIVEIRGGGKSYIRVTDDGCGISPDEAETAFLRHATSKIEHITDLSNIRTLGFRGEALASIAAVSKLTIVTRTHDRSAGIRMMMHGGRVVSKETAGANQGTTIVVEDLFYNTPARRKFMGTDAREGSAVIELIQQYAVCYPDIRFMMVRNGETVFTTRGDGDALNAIQTLYPDTDHADLIPVEGEHVSGFVSDPGTTKSTRRGQLFFVNGRLVDSKVIEKGIEAGYGGRVFSGYPIAILFIDADPSEIDVNIHPGKREIRFLKAQEISEQIAAAIRAAMQRKDSIPAGLPAKSLQPAEPVKNAEPLRSAETAEPAEAAASAPAADASEDSAGSFSTVTEASGSAVEETAPVYTGEQSSFREYLGSLRREPVQEPSRAAFRPSEDAPAVGPFCFDDLEYCGYLFDSYIVMQSQDTMYLIDQHAAHERVFYEEFTGHYLSGNKYSQPVLTPFTISVSADVYYMSREWLDPLREAGFEIDDFGADTFIIRAVPSYMNLSEAEAFARSWLEGLEESEVSGQNDTVIDKLIMRSCKSAVKAGDRLSRMEIDDLIRKLSACSNPYCCPHGRPTFIRYTKYEIERSFRRK